MSVADFFAKFTDNFAKTSVPLPLRVRTIPSLKIMLALGVDPATVWRQRYPRSVIKTRDSSIYNIILIQHVIA